MVAAPGGLLISGSRMNGKTAWLGVRPVKGGASTATFFPPPDWASAQLVASGSVILTKGTVSGSWELSGLEESALTIVYPEGQEPTEEQLTLKPAAGQSNLFNWWGQHPGGAGRD